MIWEYIKYEIRTFSISFYKQYAKHKRTKTFILEKKLKQLETNANFNFDDYYLECKNNFKQIYQEKTNGIKISIAIGLNLVRNLQKFPLT